MRAVGLVGLLLLLGACNADVFTTPYSYDDYIYDDEVIVANPVKKQSCVLNTGKLSYYKEPQSHSRIEGFEDDLVGFYGIGVPLTGEQCGYNVVLETSYYFYQSATHAKGLIPLLYFAYNLSSPPYGGKVSWFDFHNTTAIYSPIVTQCYSCGLGKPNITLDSTGNLTYYYVVTLVQDLLAVERWPNGLDTDPLAWVFRKANNTVSATYILDPPNQPVSDALSYTFSQYNQVQELPYTAPLTCLNNGLGCPAPKAYTGTVQQDPAILGPTIGFIGYVTVPTTAPANPSTLLCITVFLNGPQPQNTTYKANAHPYWSICPDPQIFIPKAYPHPVYSPGFLAPVEVSTFHYNTTAIVATVTNPLGAEIITVIANLAGFKMGISNISALVSFPLPSPPVSPPAALSPPPAAPSNVSSDVFPPPASPPPKSGAAFKLMGVVLAIVAFCALVL